jgi:hypothetical protein
MVRNISVPGEKTLCYPRVQDITRLSHTILRQLLGADAVVVHVGLNGIRRASLELLKMDFEELILALKDSKKRPVISGPKPSLATAVKDSAGYWYYTSG